MIFPTIRTQDELIRLVDEAGFVPFFENDIPGFSLAECVDRSVWFPDEGEGVWEWKGPVIRRAGCAYGKFFDNKAVFISARLFPDFANFRRCGYDCDSLYEEGFAKRGDFELWALLSDHGAARSDELKRLGGYGRNGKKGFETSLTRLQMQCYAVTSDFVYRRDKYGAVYGWGLSRYETPEARFGEDFRRAVYAHSVEESEAIVREALLALVGREHAPSAERLLQKGRVTTT